MLGPEAALEWTPPAPKRAGKDIRAFFSAKPSPKKAKTEQVEK